MKAVIKYKMFAPNQKLCIIEDGHISNTIIINSFDIAEVANEIVASAKEMHIDEIDIAFEEHLNILTGETGAGKSSIIGSLGICLGGKFPKEMLRDSEKDGLVELLFSVDNDFVKNKFK